MSALLGHVRCFHHPAREASARCPSCGHSYCRECVTEHGGKILCASCLQKQAASEGVGERKDRSDWVLALLFVPAFVALWFGFHLVGRGLGSVPATFHKASFWQGP